MPGLLTTHVLDTARGVPAAGLRVTLDRLGDHLGDGRAERLADLLTNADGRTDGPILPPGRWSPGTYELTFHAGDYLRAAGLMLADPPFLDRVPVRFGMGEGHHHVPLLLSPFGYSTYRGS